MAHRIVAEFDALKSTFEAEAQLRAEGFSFARKAVERERADAAPDGVTEQPEEWLIICEAPFGRALRATQILKHCGAVTLREVPAAFGRHVDRHESSGGDHVSTRSVVRSPDQSFFVSSLFGLPLLLDCPAPLSSLLGLPTLLRD